MTIRTALHFTQRQLENTSDAPALDASWLLLEVLGREETSWLMAHDEETLSVGEEQRYRALVARRATGEPLAYILRWWEFYGRRFVVTPDVLVPRPSTEALIDEALKFISILRTVEMPRRPLAIADVGTGSGCIAVTLALESPIPLQICATDISKAALAVARENARRHGVLDRITFLAGDMLEPLAGCQVDLLVSNPPYVPTTELPSGTSTRRPSSSPVPIFTHPVCKNGDGVGSGGGVGVERVGLGFEPRVALDGGRDGMRYVRQLKKAGVPAVVEGSQGSIHTFAVPEAVT